MRTDETTAPPDPAPAPRPGGTLRELPVLVVVAFVVALLVKSFLLQAFYIPSSSMRPTLRIGDRVLVNKVIYHLSEPARGDIVVFTAPDGTGGSADDEGLLDRVMRTLASGLGAPAPGEQDFIKRVMGLPGERVEVRDGVLLVDGRRIREAPARRGGYLAARDSSDFGPEVVPPGEYFMLGDNRPNSADSRYALGTIDEEQLIGQAFVVIWPLPDFQLLGLGPSRLVSAR
ncbi:MAG: signal peptidase I [Actinomycetota bacterium]|nr:signal peptidase I [Actinomycetota bacterium]